MHLIYSTSGYRRWNKYSYSVADISICLCLLSVTCFVYSFPGTFPETRPAWGDREGPGPLSRSGLLSAPVVLEGFPFITATWGGGPKGSPSMGPPKEKLVWLLNSQTFGYSLRSHSQTHCKKKKKKKRNVAACSTQLSTCRKMLYSCCETTWCMTGTWQLCSKWKLSSSLSAPCLYLCNLDLHFLVSAVQKMQEKLIHLSMEVL